MMRVRGHCECVSDNTERRSREVKLLSLSISFSLSLSLLHSESETPDLCQDQGTFCQRLGYFRPDFLVKIERKFIVRRLARVVVFIQSRQKAIESRAREGEGGKRHKSALSPPPSLVPPLHMQAV